MAPSGSTRARQHPAEASTLLKGGREGAAGTPVPGSQRKFTLGIRPPLTGIRAFGITSVLIYHSDLKTFPGAWQALGMFFTLSGFLITAMLVGERERTGRVSIRAFYGRRAVRLLPPLFITVVGLGLYAAFVFVAEAPQRVWGDITAAVFYFADYRLAFQHEPFFGYLAQTWSLSVEEQFYAIWALVLALALRSRHRAIAYGLAVAGIAGAAINRYVIIHTTAHFTFGTFARVYYAFDTRADAIFLGCLLGLMATSGAFNNWPLAARRALSGAAFASILVLLWVGFKVPLGTRDMVTWWIPASEVLWAVVIVYFVVCPTGLGSRFVGLAPFVFVGDMSYTLYLVHWPVYVMFWPRPGHYWPTELLRLAVIFGIAIPSWFFIEQPLMRWRRRRSAV